MKNHIKYSKAISWFSDCRIPFVDEKINFDRPRVREKKQWVYELGITWENPEVKEYNSQGRFPANILVSDDMLNDGVISKSNDNIRQNKRSYMIYNQNEINTSETKGFNDKGTNSRYYDIDKWFDKILND